MSRAGLKFSDISKDSGENIYHEYHIDCKKIPTAREIVMKWYAPGRDYDYVKNSLDYNYLYFTQIIWKETKEMGVGFYCDENTGFLAVANYFPKGNIKQKANDNIFKPNGN